MANVWEGGNKPVQVTQGDDMMSDGERSELWWGLGEA